MKKKRERQKEKERHIEGEKERRKEAERRELTVSKVEPLPKHKLKTNIDI